MSIFYVLPSRPVLGERFAGYLQSLFPGLDWSRTAWPALGEALEAAAVQHPDVYVVYRDDLPEENNLTQILVDGFGAEEGDQVVEIHAVPPHGELGTRYWRLGAAA
jgi:hypothetical protein